MGSPHAKDIPNKDEAASEDGKQAEGAKHGDPERLPGLGGEIGAAGGTQAAGGGDFVSAVIAVVNGFRFGVARDGEGEEDEAEGPERNEAQGRGDEEKQRDKAAAADMHFAGAPIGVNGFGGGSVHEGCLD